MRRFWRSDETGCLQAGTAVHPRLQLLITTAESFGVGYPAGAFKKQAIARNLIEICKTMGIDAAMDGISCLSVT